MTRKKKTPADWAALAMLIQLARVIITIIRMFIN